MTFARNHLNISLGVSVCFKPPVVPLECSTRETGIDLKHPRNYGGNNLLRGALFYQLAADRAETIKIFVHFPLEQENFDTKSLGTNYVREYLVTRF